MEARRVLLGVTGGIAAYKSAELVRRLREHGAQVQVVMTRGARRFIAARTFQALSGRPVRTDLWDRHAEAAMGHIELARWAERVIVAPASADFLARLAQGRADDLLATLCLATRAPIVAAPAMNQQMWLNPATQANVALLVARGVHLLGPAAGEQACGEIGPGRMLEPAELLLELERLESLESLELLGPLAGTEPACAGPQSATAPLAGRRVLITAGPTRERIDPVRFISNRSSGKMGFAMARAMRQAGAEVVLVSGPVNLSTPSGVRRIDVENSGQMYQAVMQELPGSAIFIGTAAVADYRPEQVSERKIKKSGPSFSLQLQRTPDILAAVAASVPRPFVVGFAAETDTIEQYAREKLLAKNLDLIAANEVGHSKAFDSNENSLVLLWRGGRLALPAASKQQLAETLTDLIVQRFLGPQQSVPAAASHGASVV